MESEIHNVDSRPRDTLMLEPIFKSPFAGTVGQYQRLGWFYQKKKKAENATQGMSCVWLYFFDHMINRNLVPRPRSRGQSGQRRRRNGTWLLSDLSRAIWLHVRQDLSGAALGAALTNSMFSNFP